MTVSVATPVWPLTQTTGFSPQPISTHSLPRTPPGLHVTVAIYWIHEFISPHTQLPWKIAHASYSERTDAITMLTLPTRGTKVSSIQANEVQAETRCMYETFNYTWLIRHDSLPDYFCRANHTYLSTSLFTFLAVISSKDTQISNYIHENDCVMSKVSCTLKSKRQPVIFLCPY